MEGADGSVWEVAISVDRERSVCGGSVEGDWPQVEAEQIYAVELQGEWVQVKYAGMFALKRWAIRIQAIRVQAAPRPAEEGEGEEEGAYTPFQPNEAECAWMEERLQEMKNVTPTRAGEGTRCKVAEGTARLLVFEEEDCEREERQG